MAEEATTQETQEQEVETTQEGLENFDWDTDGSGDFFGIEGTGIEKKDDVQKVVEEVKKKETPPVEKTGEEEEEEVTFFETEETTASEEEEEESEALRDYASLTKKMQEKGIFQNVEISEDEELNEDKFIEFHDQEIEARVDEALEGFLEELDEDGKAFLQFKKDGGDTKAFFEVYGKSKAIPEGDLEEESYQEAINRYYYSNVEKLEASDIDDRIEWLKDSGKLQKYAEKNDQKVKELDKKTKEDLKKQAKAAEKAAADAREAFVNSVQEALDNTDEVDNFKFDPKTKKRLQSFITKPSVKIGKNRYLTGMQAKLQETLKSPDKMLVLAKLLESDFDVSDVVKSAKTQTTKKVKEDLQRSKKTTRPSTSGKTGKQRSLTDFF